MWGIIDWAQGQEVVHPDDLGFAGMVEMGLAVYEIGEHFGAFRILRYGSKSIRVVPQGYVVVRDGGPGLPEVGGEVALTDGRRGTVRERFWHLKDRYPYLTLLLPT